MVEQPGDVGRGFGWCWPHGLLLPEKTHDNRSQTVSIPSHPEPARRDALTAPALAFENLSKTFGAFRAVADVSLAVRPGEIVALLGPNGAGKTTIIRMLMGILRPTAGTARIAGRDCFTDRVEGARPARAGARRRR